ncbi:MAG: hypothetical protein V4549_07485 [Bacteroidota bacterium]
MTNKKLLLAQDYAAPDSLQYFHEQFKEKFGIDFNEWKKQAKSKSLDDHGFDCQYSHNNIIVTWSVDDHFYKVYEDTTPTILDYIDWEKCESCEGLFHPDKIESNGEQTFCKNCFDDFKKEIFKAGVDNLVEYLESRKLVSDFHIFAHAKFSLITEEEFKELQPDIESEFDKIIELNKLLKHFESINYKSYGHGAIMLYWLTENDGEWSVVLRNSAKTVGEDFKGKTPLESLKKLYQYCVNENYLSEL